MKMQLGDPNICTTTDASQVVLSLNALVAAVANISQTILDAQNGPRG